jgi:type IV secretion system protein TrbG
MPPQARPDMSGLSNLDIENLHFHYLLEGDKKLGWYPVSVFDDGNKVFIKMGERASRSQLPVFHTIGKGGQPEVVNYRYRKPYFIVDTLFDQGELVLGSGKYQLRVFIRRKGA